MGEEIAAVIDIGSLRRTCASCGLSALCLPAGIGGDDLKRLDEIVQSRRPIDRGQTLYANDSPMNALYVVRSGSFKTIAAGSDGSQQVLGFHLPGEIMGFDAVADDRHQCSAEALERSTVCEVPMARLTQVASGVPALSRQLMRVISREVQQDHEHLVMMGRRQAQSRLAIFLLSLSERHRRLHHDPHQFELSMSRYDLANYLGLVVETVSRMFTRMQQLGAIDVDRKRISILDAAKLHAMTGDEENCESTQSKRA